MIKFIKKKIFESTIFQICYCVFLEGKYNIVLQFKKNRKALHLVREVFVKKVYAKHFPFDTNATIIDVGAHYGYFSLFAAKNTKTKSTIYAFEPSIDNFNIMQENVSNNNISNIVTFHQAVYGETGFSNLTKFNHQNNSLYAQYLNTDNSETEEVTCITLNDIIDNQNISHIHFLKLDCEASEYEILLNCSKETFSKIEVICCELHDMRKYNFAPERIITYLTLHGYKYDEVNYKFPVGFNKIITFYKK